MNNKVFLLCLLLGLSLPFLMLCVHAHIVKVRRDRMLDSADTYNPRIACAYKCGRPDSAFYYMKMHDFWVDSSCKIDGDTAVRDLTVERMAAKYKCACDSLQIKTHQ